MNRHAAATAVAALALAANIVLQRFLMNIGAEGRVLIPGLADFQPAWNRGISFSLFVQDSRTGWHLLVALLAVISTAVAVLMWRATNRLAAMGFALILGGALGNLCDRVLHDGAVFDFLSLHLGGLPLFVCNLPDIFISAGAVLLFLDMLLEKPAVETAL
ncbi:MAG TPA: signal peptidase II [Rhizomicrobium sp.]